MKNIFCFSFLVSIFFSFPAIAQWIHTESGGAFDNDPSQLTFGVSGQYSVGLTCTSEDDATIIFITSERASPEEARLMNIASPKLLLRVDSQDPFELDAESKSSNNGELSIISDLPDELIDQIETAESSVSVAMRVVGDIFHETRFSVLGLNDAVTSLKENCEI